MEKISIDELTIGQMKELKQFFGYTGEQMIDHPYKIGEIYHVRTVTMAIAGKLTAVYAQELVFLDAAWIADSGKFAKSLVDPNGYSEVEPFPDGVEVVIGRGSIVDCVRRGEFSRKQK